MAEALAPAVPAHPSPSLSLRRHQTSILALTFFSYASFHAARKPPSIVKSVLSSWAPFDGPEGPHRLGELDLAFLSAYAAAMFAAGHVADRADLRRFLALAMFASAALAFAFSIAYFGGIHSFLFFITVSVLFGAAQSVGWPCVVSVVGNWFGKSKRGLIMGVWNSNTSVGNILGSVLAASLVELGWGWSFVLPSVLIGVLGVVVWFFLVADPKELGFNSPTVELELKEENACDGEEAVLLEEKIEVLDGDERLNVVSGNGDAIGFLDAWRLPGVAPYACCLFFSKLVAYTFLYWLPFYIRNNAVAGELLSHKSAGILSTVFDVGGVLGGISSGFLSDKIGARAITSVLFLFLSIPSLVIYRLFGSLSMKHNIGLMFLSGYFVNGPYALITTAVAADLGTQDTIKANSRALATVTSIIDGTGSIGAALGPLLTGYISTRGWNSVFAMLIISLSLAIVFLARLAKDELLSKLRSGN